MAEKIKIILVEDEFVSAIALKRLLEAKLYSVVGHFSSGERAITCLADTPADLVLMDIGLSGQLDGIETAAIVKEQYGLPIIFITGYYRQDLMDRATKLQPLGYLIKPVEIEQLTTIVEAYFDL